MIQQKFITQWAHVVLDAIDHKRNYLIRKEDVIRECEAFLREVEMEVYVLEIVRVRSSRTTVTGFKVELYNTLPNQGLAKIKSSAIVLGEHLGQVFGQPIRIVTADETFVV